MYMISSKGLTNELTGGFGNRVPHPGCLAKRVWKLLILRKLRFSERLNSPQEYVGKGVRVVGECPQEISVGIT